MYLLCICYGFVMNSPISLVIFLWVHEVAALKFNVFRASKGFERTIKYVKELYVSYLNISIEVKGLVLMAN